MREVIKSVARGLALAAVLPELASYWLRSQLVGKDRALEGSTQLLGLVPGLTGEYLRRAFLSCVLEHCHPSAVIGFGTVFSQTTARIDENVYIGPRCQLGLVHLERDVLLAAGVHVPSGRHTHASDDPALPIRAQPMKRELVRIGAGAWIGSAAVVMADVGAGTIVGAGAVVAKPLPANVVAAGVPARVIRARGG
ncbi:MAG: acyltransferase [Gemmataceae bacterium]